MTWYCVAFCADVHWLIAFGSSTLSRLVVQPVPTLPSSDGNVGTIGQSYLGATQYLMSWTAPPSLKAQVPVSAAADFHSGWVYDVGGALVHGWALPYAVFLARNTIDRMGLKDELWPKIRPSLERPINFANPFTDEAYRHLPLMDWADLLEEVAPYVRDYLTLSLIHI